MARTKTCAPVNGIERAIRQAGSQQALAEMLGITQQSVSAMKLRGWLSNGHALKVSRAYNIPVRELVSPRVRLVMA